MLSYYRILFFLIFFISFAFGQYTIGIKGGFNYGKFGDYNGLKFKSTPNFSVGIYCRKVIGIDFFYNAYGATENMGYLNYRTDSFTNGYYKYRLHTISIPIYSCLSIKNSNFIQIGMTNNIVLKDERIIEYKSPPYSLNGCWLSKNALNGYYPDIFFGYTHDFMIKGRSGISAEFRETIGLNSLKGNSEAITFVYSTLTCGFYIKK